MDATMDIGLKLASKFAWFTPVNAAYGINHNHSIVPTQCLVKAVRGGTCPLLADCPRSTSFAQSQSHWQNCTEGGRCTPVPDDIVHLAFLELGQQAQTFPYVSRSVPVLHKVPLFFFLLLGKTLLNFSILLGDALKWAKWQVSIKLGE